MTQLLLGRTIKKAAYFVINRLLLAPLGLRLSFRVGSDPMADIGRLLKREKVGVVIDGGAHTGSFALEAMVAFPAARIIAFEPASEPFEHLKRQSERAGRIEAHKLALGAKAETREFFNNTFSQTSSLRRPTAAAEKYFSGLVTFAGSEDVQVVTLSEFFTKNRIDKTEVIKLDLQGYEMEALLGAGKFIHDVSVVFAEVQFLRIYEDSALFRDIDAFLSANGLEFYQFYNLVRSPRDGRLLYADAIFAKSALLRGLDK